MAFELAFPAHPGEVLGEDVLPRFNLSVTDAASMLGVARPGFNNVVNGKRAVTPDLALKIERVFDYPARLLIAMQSAYDLAIARHDEALATKLGALTPAAVAA